MSKRVKNKSSGVTETNLFTMGVEYSCGRGKEADLIEAHKWFNLASLRGDVEAARRRQELASEMSPSQVADAQRRAREWLSTQSASSLH